MCLARRTSPAAVLLSLLTIVLGSALLIGPLAVPATAASDTATTYAQQAYTTTNIVREDRDRVQLRKNDCLQKFADAQANRLAGSEVLDHQALNPILDVCNLSLVGENLALGFENGRAAVRQGWMKSSGHRANIVKSGYRLMAISARKTDSGRWVVVQLFGRKA